MRESKAVVRTKEEGLEINKNTERTDGNKPERRSRKKNK